MSKIIACNNEITDIYYSGYTISKVYACGGQLVYAKDEEPTPSDNWKLKMDFSNGHTGYLACDSTSAITKGEVQTTHRVEDGGLVWALSYTAITSVTVGSCVTSIESAAFSGMTNLQRVISFGENLTTIKNDAFNGCTGLTQIYIPCSCTTIGSYAFFGCSSVTALNICSGVETIGGYAFYGLSSYSGIVNIPSSVTSIGNGAFYGMVNVTRYNVNPVSPPALNNSSKAFHINANTATSAPIYVKTLSTYRSARGWTEYINNLVQM